MKVLLINPAQRFAREQLTYGMPPLGLQYLVSAIKDSCQVDLYDAFIADPDNKRKVERNFWEVGASDAAIKARLNGNLSVVGIGCVFSQNWPVVARLARMIKGLNSKIKIVVGGNHPTFLARDILADDHNIDYVILGEGESTFKQLLRTIAQTQSRESLEAIPGLAFRNQQEVTINSQPKPFPDLDQFAFPDRKPADMQRYFQLNKFHGKFPRLGARIATMITSRGCPYECIFCNSKRFWNGYRSRSPENVLSEIESLINTFKVNEIQFLDDNIALNKDRFKQICRGMLSRNFNLAWCLPNGIDLNALDESIIQLMAESGCYEIGLPFESGSSRVLRQIIGKRTNLEQAKKLVPLLHKYRIRTYGFFVIGSPGETQQERNQTYDFAKGLRLFSTSFNIMSVSPGTRAQEVLGLDRESFYYNSNSRANYQSVDIQRAQFKFFVKLEILSFLHHPVKIIHILNNFYKSCSIFKTVMLNAFNLKHRFS